MAQEADDFDVPVRDYDFADISADDAREVSGLLDAVASAGRFSATKLACSRHLLRDLCAPLAPPASPQVARHLN